MSSPKAGKLSIRARAAYCAASIATFAAIGLFAAPDAFARYGRGLVGETTDKLVTFTMLLLISGIVVLITVLSLIQWRLDKRKAVRKAAEHANVGGVDWRGGW
ncbi:MAG: hypothetical protein ACYCUM_00520 [Solirubrobacteraceae bacterium]